MGLSAPTADFLDHIIALTERGGSHLFTCFDDPRIPANTNKLEGFFGHSKEFVRHVNGDASTTNSPIRNLGGSLLVTFFRSQSLPPLRAEDLTNDLDAYKKARAALEQEEAPARRRRSLVRHPQAHIDRLLAGYRRHLGLPSPP